VAEGHQHPPLVLDAPAVEQAGHVPDFLDEPGGDLVRVKVDAQDFENLLLPRVEQERLLVQLGELVSHGRVAALDQAIGDAVENPPLLVLELGEFLVNLAGIENLPTEKLANATDEIGAEIACGCCGARYHAAPKMKNGKRYDYQ